MALADKIKQLQEAAAQLAEAKGGNVNATESGINGISSTDMDDEGEKEISLDGTNKNKGAEGGSTDNAASGTAKIKAKQTGQDPKPTGPNPVKESIDLGALFEGEELSEEFKSKVTTVFEAAVEARVKQEVELMENELALRALTESEELKEGLVEKVDGYLDFMVEQWMKNNEIALERGIKAEIFESFIGQMRDVFIEHSINMPDEEFDIVESLQAKTEALEEVLDEQVAQNIELNKTIKSFAKQAKIQEATTGMTDIDAEKFALLAEEIAFDDETSFAKKLDVIRENYVGRSESAEVKQLTEDVTQGSNEPVNEMNESVKVDPAMAQYLTAFK